MVVHVISSFQDIAEGVARNPGDTFECSKERAGMLVGYGLVVAPKQAEEPVEEPVKKPTKKTTKKVKE